jgi:signal transduction histidine kinase
VLLLETRRPLTDEQLDFMQVLTARIAVAVDNASLYQISQQQLAELKTLYERVSQLEQIKTDMIRIAAHDLRNPINVVTGFAELLLEMGHLPEAEQDQVSHIFVAGRRMQKLVADILSLERIEQIQAGENLPRLDLAALIDQVYQAQQYSATQHEFRINKELESIFVRGDAPQLHEAITNLVTNAFKYTSAGGRVEICLSTDDKYAILKVIDTGYGIPDEMQARLFQPFYRVRSQETYEIEGTGLGLHLVKNIIERHNGTMQFHSVYGQGSTFGFRLPLALDVPDNEASQTAHEPSTKAKS